MRARVKHHLSTVVAIQGRKGRQPIWLSWVFYTLFKTETGPGKCLPGYKHGGWGLLNQGEWLSLLDVAGSQGSTRTRIKKQVQKNSKLLNYCRARARAESPTRHAHKLRARALTRPPSDAVEEGRSGGRREKKSINGEKKDSFIA